MEPSSPTSPPFIDNFDADHRLHKAKECLREAIQELRLHWHCTSTFYHHSSSECPLYNHGLDESCMAHAIDNLCQTFLFLYDVRVDITIDILLHAFKLVRGQSYFSLLDLKSLVSEKDLIVREEACQIDLLFGGFTGSYHALRCLL